MRDRDAARDRRLAFKNAALQQYEAERAKKTPDLAVMHKMGRLAAELDLMIALDYVRRGQVRNALINVGSAEAVLRELPPEVSPGQAVEDFSETAACLVPGNRV